MSEEQMPDTIEKLYERLNDYDKQQLMNYGYLMEYTRTLEKEVKYQNDIVIKYKEVLDKIKEWVYYQQQSNENLEPYISTDKLDDILELLEEIE